MFNAISLFDLSGKTALITGSSQGIGFALAKGFVNGHILYVDGGITASL